MSILRKEGTKGIPDPLGQELKTVKRPPAKVAHIRKSFNSLLPELVSSLMDDPFLTQNRLYKRFQDRLSDCPSLAKFKSMCAKYELNKIVEQRLSPQQQAMTVIDTLEQLRKQKAEDHERRNMKYLDKAHEVLETINPTKDTLPEYLENVGALNKLARTSYNIENEKKSDPRQMGLQALINLDLRGSHIPITHQNTVDNNDVIDEN
jgi:hypothetical protein